MKLLRKGHVFKRVAAAFLGVAAVLVTIFGAVHNHNQHVDAATKDGATVAVNPG